MSETIEVNDEPYKLDDNPSLRTVREVQSMQMDILLDYITEEQLREMDSLEDEGELIQAIIDNEGYSAFQEVMWENNLLLPMQTISLACDHKFASNVFDEMGSQDFKTLREKSEEALGGDANDFFSDLGIGMSMSSKEMERKAEQVQAGT